MRFPLDHIEVTQPFASTEIDYSSFGLKGHHGTDFQAATPLPVYAVESGTVEFSQNGVTDKYTGRFAAGEIIVINGEYESWYMHLSNRAVPVGARVSEGQLIGYTGNTGFTTGPHLHLGIRPLSPDINNGYRGFIDFEKVVKGGNTMFPNKGDLINFHNSTGWLGHQPNDNDVAYWTTGTGNPNWSKGADEVWKALCYDVSQWVLNHPTIVNSDSNFVEISGPVFKKK